MENSLQLYSYDDHKNFLKDYFQKKKELRNTFSLRFFAQKAGFSDHSQLTHLLSGRRNVTAKSMIKLIDGLELTGSSKEYFTYLVYYTQAKTAEEKEKWYKELNIIREKSEFYEVNRKQYDFFSEWYYPIVRDLATSPCWDRDYKKLGELLEPEITATQAKEAVEFLQEIGMIEPDNDGYKKCDNVITTGSIPIFMIHKARNVLAKLGSDTTEKCSDKEVINANTSILLSEKNLDKYYDLIEKFENKFEKLVVDENGKQNRMYQMNLQFFPTTVSLTQEK